MGLKHSQAGLQGGMGALLVGMQCQVLCYRHRCVHVPIVSNKALARLISQQSLGWWARVLVFNCFFLLFTWRVRSCLLANSR